MSRCNIQASTNGFLIYKPSKASASIIHLYWECVLSARASFCLHKDIENSRNQRTPETRGFSGDRTGSSDESPPHTHQLSNVH